MHSKGARGTTCGRVPHSGDAGPHAVVILAGRRVVLHVLDPAVPDGVQRCKVRLALHCCWHPRQQTQQYCSHWLTERPERMQKFFTLNVREAHSAASTLSLTLARDSVKATKAFPGNFCLDDDDDDLFIKTYVIAYS